MDAAQSQDVDLTTLVWPRGPRIYEIDTWVWLFELSRKYGTRVDLSCVDPAEWDAIAEFGFDAMWLMGVWERSPAGIAIANRNQSLRDDFERALPDFREEDDVGSPYCVRRYSVDPHLGGDRGLAVARQELVRRGMRLILDFVPNHVAPDHPWVIEHPEYFVQGSAEDLRSHPASFLESGGHIFACGRDPYFPPWSDVLQLNAFHSGLRQAVVETISSIASQCDGVRCDMAMLLLNSIFERTWGYAAGQRPQTEYWSDVIPAVKKAYPNFLFMAEAYWDLEGELQQRGFDFCYDKRLYDRLEHESAEAVRLHLCAELGYQERLVRFIENHDEPRAAATFSPEKLRAAAVTIATVPGARLFYEGQFEGRKVKLPVFLGRRPDEPVDQDLFAFYSRLLKAINAPAFREGRWSLCERSGWPEDSSYLNLVAWSWRNGDDCCLVVVNLTSSSAQGQVRTPWNELRGRMWRLSDSLSGASFERNGDEMLSPGLYVGLGPWQYHLLRFGMV
ncbi:MAG: alpha-amylase [Acidobacteriaceae bacterium]|nr:alpha-amylase [Acidobacteriaceae bacterium]MBV9502821.1 alpha-amylase [Acidobacteriaceae bacterium]